MTNTFRDWLDRLRILATAAVGVGCTVVHSRLLPWCLEMQSAVRRRVLSNVTPRMATTAVLAGALGHAALSFILWDEGHAPSSTWLPAEHHYLVQAALAGPLYLAQWHLLSRVVASVLQTSRHNVLPVCGWVLGNCTLGLLVVPDTILYWRGGFSALRWGAPFVLVLLFFGTWFWLSVRLRRVEPSPSTRRVALAALAGLIAQAILGALIIR